jgi:hypothetical protein
LVSLELPHGANYIALDLRFKGENNELLKFIDYVEFTDFSETYVFGILLE